MSRAELIELAKKNSAVQIKNKYFVSLDQLRDVYAKYNIHAMLRYSTLFIQNTYRRFDHDDFATSQYLGMSIVELHEIPTIKEKSSCRFKRAREICQDLGYKDALHFLRVEGVRKFQNQITPKL